MKERPTYKSLLKQPGKEIIIRRYNNMEKRAVAFLVEDQLSEYVGVNHAVLNAVMLDYFADIERLKSFAGIEHANKNKITAYMAYWWLRRKPLQILSDIDLDDGRLDDIVYVNERFIATFLTKDFMYPNTQELRKDAQCNRFIRHILYHLKYRIYTPQTLELMLMSVDSGISIGRINAYTPES